MSDLNIRGYYWLENSLIKNLGDYLVEIVLERLGYKVVGHTSADQRLINPGRCLLSVGSVLWDRILQGIPGPVDVWGSGWRGVPLSPEVMSRVRFWAVRGPGTIAGLGLPPHTPQGDPVLLLPQLSPRPIRPHNQTLVVPHFSRLDQMDAASRCQLTGCDELLSMRVIGRPAPTAIRISSKRLFLKALKSWAQLGIPVGSTWQAIDRIAGAGFVLTGSLHGAILAQAYGIPWAAYDDGYVDVPEKWRDWGDYLGICIAFVSDLRCAEQWWKTEGQRGKLRDTSALLAAFPYRRDPQTMGNINKEKRIS